MCRDKFRFIFPKHAAKAETSGDKTIKPTKPVRENNFLGAIRFLWEFASLWPSVLLLVSGILFMVYQVMVGANQFYAADIALAVAILILGTKTIHWLFHSNINPNHRTWATTIIVLCCVVPWYLQHLWIRSKAIIVEGIQAKVLFATVSLNRDSRIAILTFNGSHGVQATPINLILFLAITNKSKTMLTLSRAQVEYKESWFSWRPIIVLPPGGIFFGPSPKRLLKLVPSVSSVAELSEKPVEAEKAYIAYSTYQFPANFKATRDNLRLRVCDLDNNCSISALPAEDENQSNNGGSGVYGGYLTFTQPITDLSGLYISFWDRRDD